MITVRGIHLLDSQILADGHRGVEVILTTVLLAVSFLLILHYVKQKDTELYLPAVPRLYAVILYFGTFMFLLSGLYSFSDTTVFAVLLLNLAVMSFTDHYTGLVYPAFSYFILVTGIILWVLRYLDDCGNTAVLEYRDQLIGMIIYYVVLYLLQKGKVFSSGDTKVYLCAALFLTFQESDYSYILRWTANHVISTAVFLIINVRHIDLRHFRLLTPRPFIPSISVSTILILLLFAKHG